VAGAFKNNMHRGYIKIWRKLLEWEWFLKPETLQVFLYLLLKANYKESKFMGYTVNRGQIVTGRNSLSEKLTLSPRTVRTSLERLKTTNEITIKTTNKFSIITLCNYETYQNDFIENDQQNDQQNDKPTTSKRPANDQQTTTSKEFKNSKNSKNKTYTTDYESFWSTYPKKIGKGAAFKIWVKLPVGVLPLILSALEWQKNCDQWKKDHGQYIPNPSTYLNQSRWEDEPIKQPATNSHESVLSGVPGR
jgi:hypothetical protein